ncbi:hypothetical protein TNCV_857141 [Trichonephila clavipes]|nr:hypothetical protein TNCV_857141 [Trichonephila clavipes]
MLNDDEIVTSVQAESDPIDDETDEDEDNNNQSSKGPSNAGAFSALDSYGVVPNSPRAIESWAFNPRSAANSRSPVHRTRLRYPHLL